MVLSVEKQVLVVLHRVHIFIYDTYEKNRSHTIPLLAYCEARLPCFKPFGS